MYKILVSGKSKGVGKTTLIEKFINNLKGDICVIKSSIHKKYQKYELIDNNDIILEENTDTAIFKNSGASKVYYLKSNITGLKNNIDKIKSLNNFDYLIVEGNSIIEFLDFNLIYYIDKEGGDLKKSAEKCKKMADVIIKNDGSNDIVFNKDKISCLKAHIIGHSFDIPLIKIGQMLNDRNIRINKCQLGLF